MELDWNAIVLCVLIICATAVMIAWDR